MLPPDLTSPKRLSGGLDSPTKSIRKVDFELKMEATRQFFLNDNQHKSNAHPSTSSRRSSMGATAHPSTSSRRSSMGATAHPSTSSRRSSMGATAHPSTSSRRSSIGALPDSKNNVRPPRHFKCAAPNHLSGGPNHDDGDGYGTDSEAPAPSKRAQSRRASLTVKHQMQLDQQKQQPQTASRSRRASMSASVKGYDMGGRTPLDPTMYAAAPLRKNATSRANPGKKLLGINPDALARMSHHETGAVGGTYDEDNDVDFDYDYDEEDDACYGYGYGCSGAFGGPGVPATAGPAAGFGYGLPAPRLERRGSNRSHASAASRRSKASAKRDNSHLVRKDSDTAPPRVEDCYLQPSSASEEDGGAHGYGLNANSSDQDSAVESDTDRSFCSNACSRRNSCSVPLGQDALAAVQMLDIDDDLKDPDSMLTRSGYFSSVKPGVPKNSGELSRLDVPSMKETIALVKANARGPVEPPIIAQQPPQAWNRSVPFTTSHEPLTKEKLDMRGNYPTENNFGVAPGWEKMSSDEDDGSDSDESFGASMYADPTYQEIDRYQQRARRRESLELSWVDMGVLLAEGGTDRPGKIPDFTPAAGCTNASDYIVRWFTARLRAGMTVIKHNRSRWSKSQLRVLYLLPDGKTLTWKPLEGEIDKGKRPKLDLSKCKEVRHAWSQDPDTRKQVGTATLRKRCKDGTANKSLALIFRQRTLDMTALSTDQCRVLMEGFSALACRLQMVALKDDNASSSEDIGKDTTGRSYAVDDDWASTVYGGDSTASMTQSGLSTAAQKQLLASPWGF